MIEMAVLFEGQFCFVCWKDMLSYPIPKSLGCASYVARIISAPKFINYGTFSVDRNAILLNGWKDSPSAVNNARVDSIETFCYGLPNLTLESQSMLPIHGSLKKNWALLSSQKTCDLLLGLR